MKISTHRHGVLLPLFLVFATFSSVAQGSVSVIAMTQESSSEVRMHRSGIAVRAEPHTDYDAESNRIFLREGSLMIASDGEVAVDVRGATLVGLHGGFSVIRHGSVLTVAALTTPVLIMHGKARVLVPVGRQWRGDPEELHEEQDAAVWRSARSVTVLPDDFLSSALSLLAKFPNASSEDLLPAAVSDVPVQPSGMFRLTSAQKRAEEQWLRESLGALRSALDEGAIHNALGVLEEEKVQSALATHAETIRPMLLVLTSHALGHAAIAQRLLGFSLVENTALLASVHPKFRNLFWTMPEAEKFLQSSEGRLVATLTFPEADALPSGAADIARDAWTSFAKAHLMSLGENGTPFLEVLSHVVIDAIAFAEREKYAERARGYMASLRTIAEGRTDVSSRVRAELQRIDSLDVLRLTAQVSTQESTSQGSSNIDTSPSIAHRELTSAEKSEIEARARTLLQTNGALWSVRTAISAIGGSEARIRDIVFSNSEGDRTFALTLDTETLLVRDTETNGKTLPFAVSLEQFLVWVRGEE